jgi:lysophospholipase
MKSLWQMAWSKPALALLLASSIAFTPSLGSFATLEGIELPAKKSKTNSTSSPNATDSAMEDTDNEAGTGSSDTEAGDGSAANAKPDLGTAKSTKALDPTSVEARRERAIDYIDRGNFTEAEEILRDLARAGDADSLMDHAACHFRNDQYDEAVKLCQEAYKKGPGKHYDRAIIKLGLAECLYKKKAYADAEREFQESLALLDKNDSSMIAIFALEGLGGCYLQHKEYRDAVKALEELARLNRDLFGSTDIGYGWALMQLSEAYRKSGRESDAAPMFEKAVWIFRETNRKRLATEFSDPSVQQQLSKMVFGTGDSYRNGDDSTLQGKSKYLAKTNPELQLPHCAWRRQFRQVDAPGYVWCDPTVPMKALLICVHGLGLHHQSFNSFARRIAPRGIVSVSFDVRGFGTYLASKGQDDLQFKDCVDDLKAVIKLIRGDHPDKPLFVLGESMGGAIALHMAAEAPELLDGVICSVPSGARHQGASTALKVGLRYLKNKNSPMNIGDQVIKQATGQEALRNDWSNDPAARLKLTPKELVSFQSFMSQNVEAARKITKTPVILFQGDNDRLVKKTGTYDLFEAIGSKQKTLVLLGNTEHLIFEAGQFQDDVTLGVIEWMGFHGQKRQQSSKERNISKSE